LNIFPGIERQRSTDSEGASDIKTIEIATVHLATPLWRLQGFHITVSVVATLAHLKADPEELSREGFSSFFLNLRSFLG
jgi:hypothetical protein